MMENKTILIVSDFSALHKRGRTINMWFHFTRNNSRTTEYYYNWLVSLFGADNWATGNASFKQQWENAKNSFDRMYGLIKGWQAAHASLSLELPANDQKDKEIERLTKKIEDNKKSAEEKQADLQKKIAELTGQLEDKKKEFDKAIEALNQAVEEVARSRAAIAVTVRNEPREGDHES